MASAVVRIRSASPRPTISAILSNVTFSSWTPTSSFVAGVKIGPGSFEDSTSPFGNGTPQTLPVFEYSAHPDPDKYPRTTHSTGRGLVFMTHIARPFRRSQ